MEIIIDSVRCFIKKQRIPIKPLTVLVGENSTGKTTFLSVLSSVCNPERFPGCHSFNEPPFDMGSYDSIASRAPQHRRPAASFRIGLAVEHGEDLVETVATYTDHHGQARLTNFSASNRGGELEIVLAANNKVRLTVRLQEDRGHEARPIEYCGDLPKRVQLSASSLPNFVFMVINREKVSRDEFNAVLNLAVQTASIPREVLAVAPIRTKPRRIYDQFRDEFVPEGDHIPLMLASLLCAEESDKRRKSLECALADFGRSSGLFEAVKIQELGAESRPPFKVLVTIAGQAVNLADVGYGVSQSLPIVVQSILSSPQSMLLLQQPEVHLHPRAQAALGTMFASLVSSGTNFIIETHSDYLVDRIRQEVALGRVSPDQLVVLYFDKEGPFTTVHPINLDEKGELVKPPQGYREFFLQEGLNLLCAGS